MHDILFTLPLPFTDRALPVHAYGVMAMVGFLLGLWLARWRARRVGLSPETITDLLIYALIAGIVGSRVFYVVQNADHFFNTRRPGWSFMDLFEIWKGGLVFYGGFIGAGIVVLWVARARKIRLLALLDAMAPSVVLGHAFGRIGCFLHGCCYGVPLKPDAWCGVVYPEGSVAYEHVAAGTPMFPSQLVSAANKLIIFAVLMLFFKHRRVEGRVVALYLILYSIHRFIIEFWRGDTHAPGELSPAQWVSLFTFFIGLALMVFARGVPPAPSAQPVPTAKTEKKSRKA